MPGEEQRGERLGEPAGRRLGDRVADRLAEDRRVSHRRRRARRRHRQPRVTQDLPGVGHLPNVTTMAPLHLDRPRIQQLIDLAADRLEGEWLLIGGAAAALWFADGRATE